MAVAGSVLADDRVMAGANRLMAETKWLLRLIELLLMVGTVRLQAATATLSAM